MKYLIISLIVFFMINLDLYPQVQQEWVRFFDGQHSYYDEPMRILADRNGNIIVSGTSAGDENNRSWEFEYITLKFNNAGQEIWRRTFNGDSGLTEAVTDMTIDNNNNIFVTGYGFNGQNLSYDMMTLKYDDNGQQIWMGAFGNQTDYDQPRVIKTDNSGNVFVLGNTWNPNTYEDIAVLKYNNNGGLNWSRIYNTTDTTREEAGDLAVDNNGNVFVVTTSSRLGKSDAAILKYNSVGNLLWSSFYNPTNNMYDLSTSIALDNSGNIYVSGYSQINTNSSDIFLVKYNTNGQQGWVKTHKGPKGYWGFWNNYRNPSKILLSNSGDIYVISGIVDTSTTYDKILILKYNTQGTLLLSKSYSLPNSKNIYIREAILDRFDNIYFSGTIQFTSSSNNNDILTQKYNSSGDLVWSITYNGPGEPYRNNDYGISICLDSLLNVIVTGESDNGGFSTDIVTIKYSQSIGIEPISTEIPDKFALYQNYPNPFNPITKINFDLPSSQYVNVYVYDILGKELSRPVDHMLKAGKYSFDFSNPHLPSGVYFYSMVTEGFRDTKKMILLK